MEGVLAGLAHAETHGIVHRDLKPENIMVTADGRVKITDFGIAKATAAAGTGVFLTAAGTTVGTPTYMAPEQAMGRDIGIWTDLYSVGVMAWEHVVGRVPFYDSEVPMVILTRQLNEEIPAAVRSIPTPTRTCRTGSASCWSRIRPSARRAPPLSGTTSRRSSSTGSGPGGAGRLGSRVRARCSTPRTR